MKTVEYAHMLSDHRTDAGETFECQMISGEVDVLQVEVSGAHSFPIFMTQTQSQILCIVYLWTESEIIPDKRMEMMEWMLDTSISIPLSSYARVDDHYVLFGSLSIHSKKESVIEELVTLNENAKDVVEAMSDFLLEAA